MVHIQRSLRHEEHPGTKIYDSGDGVMLPSLSMVRSRPSADLFGAGG